MSTHMQSSAMRSSTRSLQSTEKQGFQMWTDRQTDKQTDRSLTLQPIDCISLRADAVKMANFDKDWFIICIYFFYLFAKNFILLEYSGSGPALLILSQRILPVASQFFLIQKFIICITLV